MDGSEVAGLKGATGLCNRLYNFFVRHFASQGAKLVTRGRCWGDQRAAEEAAMEDFHPVVTVPVSSDINKQSDAFIRSRKQILRSESSGLSPNRQA